MKTYKNPIRDHREIFFFFLATNDYSITQTWDGLGNQTGIKQPIKQIDLWIERAFLARESSISFCVPEKADNLEFCLNFST